MSILRIGGMASGFDTDSIVRDLMRIERFKVDKSMQNRQIIQWQKEQYRGIINNVRSFRDKYFDVLKPDNYLLSSSGLKKMQASSSDGSIVSVTAGAGALTGNSTFQVIQSATAAEGIASAITAGSAEGTRVSLSDTMETVSGKLQSGPLEFDENGQFAVTINDHEIMINKTDTLRTALSKINNSGAGVQASYNSFSDSLKITAKNTGEGVITTDDGGKFFSSLGLVPGIKGEIGTAGRDAVFKIDGFQGTRAKNSFTIEGVTYSITKHVDETDNSPLVNISVSVDSKGIFKAIESFVNDYNSLIEQVNGKLSEEVFGSFRPLTDEQKENMSEKDIEKWEEKAQSGLLRRDPALESMLSSMRRALYDMVGEFHLTEIGIETSRNYLENGKLSLTDGGNTLRAAIAENPDKVADIFTRQSDISYSAFLSGEQREQRYSESGLAHRISDILNDYTRTSRDNNGRKGILLERAGLAGDSTQFSNFYDNHINNINKQIDKMNEMLLRRENQYYRQFAAMEKALGQLYSQGDWLTTQLQSQYTRKT
jgi:flagellar hook-associated protein 2